MPTAAWPGFARRGRGLRRGCKKHPKMFGSVLVGPESEMKVSEAEQQRNQNDAERVEEAFDLRLLASNGVWCNWQHS